MCRMLPVIATSIVVGCHTPLLHDLDGHATDAAPARELIDTAMVMESYWSLLRDYSTTVGHLPSGQFAGGDAVENWRFQVIRHSLLKTIHAEGADERLAVDRVRDARVGITSNKEVAAILAQLRGLGWNLRIPKLARTHLRTDVVAFVGPGAAFDPGENVSLNALNDQTLLFVGCGSDPDWTETSVDVYFENVLELNRKLHAYLSARGAGEEIVVGFRDGVIWRLRHDVPADIVAVLVTRDSAAEVNRDSLLGPWKLSWVEH